MKLTDLSLGSDSITNVDVLAKLKNLTVLDLSGCVSLTNVDRLANLMKLTDLNFTGCSNISNIKEIVINCKNLKNLNVEKCEKLNLFKLSDELESKLEINPMLFPFRIFCDNDQQYFFRHQLQSKFVQSKFGFHPSDNTIREFLSNFKETKLDLSHFAELKSLSTLKYCENLTELDLRFCSSIENLEGIDKLKKLAILNLSSCRALKNIDAIIECKNIHTLSLNSCISLESIEPLLELTNLKVLVIGNCKIIKNSEIIDKLFDTQIIQGTRKYHIEVSGNGGEHIVGSITDNEDKKHFNDLDSKGEIGDWYNWEELTNYNLNAGYEWGNLLHETSIDAYEMKVEIIEEIIHPMTYGSLEEIFYNVDDKTFQLSITNTLNLDFSKLNNEDLIFFGWGSEKITGYHFSLEIKDDFNVEQLYFPTSDISEADFDISELLSCEVGEYIYYIDDKIIASFKNKIEDNPELNHKTFLEYLRHLNNTEIKDFLTKHDLFKEAEKINNKIIPLENIGYIDSDGPTTDGYILKVEDF